MVKLNLALAASLAAGALASTDAAAAASSSSSSSSSHHKLRGVAPADEHRYTPYTRTADGQQRWKCLDGSTDIPWHAVNDDYCDCPDGSDEPGTSACPNATFYCNNSGHIPARIRSSRVDDGICDPECCDGSDESDGKVHCPNTCEKVGREHRKRTQQLENLRRAGAKIRDRYIADGNREKERIESEITRLEVELDVAREREQRLKRELDRAEMSDAAVIEAKIKTPLYATLNAHQSAMKALLERNAQLKDELKTLTLLLDDLARGYNPNYQDMAVKGAVVAYKEWRGIASTVKVEEEGGDEATAAEKDEDADINAENTKLSQLLDDGEWPAQKVSDLVQANVLETMDGGLAGSGDAHAAAAAAADGDSGLLFRIHEYLPDPVVPYFEAMVDTLLDVLIKANVIKDVKRMRPKSSAGVVGGSGGGDGSGSAEPESVARVRREHTEAANALRKVESDLSSYRSKLEGFGTRYGRELEFKTLENQCISKDMGEYTYEYCFLGRAKQIPNKGGQQVTLGTFANWNPTGDSTPSEDRYWTTQIYANGQKCWNGPMRSAIIDLQCATQNEVLDVFEAEKCVYSIKVTTPAVCFPSSPASPPAAASGAEAGGHDEL